MVVALIELYQTDDRQIVSVLDTLLHLQMSAQKTGEVISEMLATLTTKPVTVRCHTTASHLRTPTCGD
jgi:hypothetical protein